MQKLRAADSQPVLDCLEKIDTASRHLAALVDDVLDMSKIENDKLQLTPQIVSLHSIIFSTLDIPQPLAEKRCSFTAEGKCCRLFCVC